MFLFDRQARVSLKLIGINLQETELKKKLTEEELKFQTEELKNCLSLEWTTEPRPILKSNLELKATFHLSPTESLLSKFFPVVLERRKRNELENRMIHFLGIKPRNFVRDAPGHFTLFRFFSNPRSIFISSVTYKRIHLTPNATFDLGDPSFQLLRFDGKIECIVKLYRLHKIKHFWKSRIFEKPAPIVGELFVKVKDKFIEKSFGETHYEFQGRFLPVKRDLYLLEYWKLKPIWNPDLLAMISERMMNHFLLLENSELLLEENLERQFPSFTTDQIKNLNSADDLASIFSPDHP